MIITIDADLQDDVNAIFEMVRKYHEGIDVVYGVRNSRRGSQFALGNGLVGILKNIVAATVMIVTGNDRMTRVELPIFGPFYPFMMVFSIVGILKK